MNKQIDPRVLNDIQLIAAKLQSLLKTKGKTMAQVSKETKFSLNTVRAVFAGKPTNILVIASIAACLDVSLLDLHTIA